MGKCSENISRKHLYMRGLHQSGTPSDILGMLLNISCHSKGSECETSCSWILSSLITLMLTFISVAWDICFHLSGVIHVEKIPFTSLFYPVLLWCFCSAFTPKPAKISSWVSLFPTRVLCSLRRPSASQMLHVTSPNPFWIAVVYNEFLFSFKAFALLFLF